MAKKAELLEKAAELKLEVSEKNTIAEIEAAIAEATELPIVLYNVPGRAKLPSLSPANVAKKLLTKLLKRQRRKLARKLATLLHNQTTLKLT